MLDNPYLPDSVRQVMLDNNLTSLYIDRTYGNFPEREEAHNRESYTLGSSFAGKLGSRFQWADFWQYGHVTDNVTEANSPWTSPWRHARDATPHPLPGRPTSPDQPALAQGSLEPKTHT